jgi:uncharacterized peroxidase-related enzyme
MQAEGVDAATARDEVDRILERLGPPGTATTPLDEAWPARDRALLVYVTKLTVTPGRMSRRDLEPLRAVGLGDGEILDIVHVAGYYAYANRIADALGIELEDYRRE